MTVPPEDPVDYDLRYDNLSGASFGRHQGDTEAVSAPRISTLTANYHRRIKQSTPDKVTPSQPSLPTQCLENSKHFHCYCCVEYFKMEKK